VATLDDYLLTGEIPLGREGEQFRNMLRTVNTYNVNRAGGQALALAGGGVDPYSLNVETRPGILDKVFGVLNAPRNLAFRIGGVDPSVTGGDVFRTRKDDSLLERAGKFAGAFAFDVVTDPLTYVGGTGILGRKGAATLAAAPATRRAALESAEGALKAAGRDSDALVETLYRNSALKKIEDAKTRLVTNLSPEEEDAFLALRGRRDNLKVTQNLTDEQAEQVIRRELAEEELGRVLGESLLLGGRKSTLDELTRLVGDRDMASQVFQSLPQEVRGGAVIRTALGKQVGRVPGTGRGTLLGKPGEFLNVTRFKASELLGRGVAGGTRQLGLSGQYGPSWQAVRSGLRRQMMDPNFDILRDNLGRTTITTYNAFKQAHRNMSRARLVGALQVWELIGEGNALERDFADRGLREDYLRGRMIGFHAPEAGTLEGLSEAEQAGMEYGRRLLGAMSDARSKMVAEGISINDLGPGYSPLYLTEQGASTRQLEQKVTRGTTGEFSYSPTIHRAEWIREIVDPEEAKLLGYRIPDTNTVALSALQINKIIGKNDFITDPIQIATRYLEHASRTIASQKFVNEALRSGVLIADVNYSATQARFDRLANFMSGVRKASPQLAKRLATARDKAEQELVSAAGEGLRDKTIKEATALRIKVNAEYNAAVEGQAAARARLREATRAAQQARAYDDALERLRAARATTRLEETPSRSGFVEDEYIALEDKYDELVLSGEAKKAAEKELSEVRSLRNRVRNAVSSSELAELDNYEAALMRREQVRAEYEAARRARLKASSTWSKFKDEPAVKSTQELTALARNLATAETAYRRAQAIKAPKNVLDDARKAVREAEKTLRGAIGYNLPKGSPLAVYRDTMIRLAKDLGVVELDAARVFSSEARMTELLGQMEEAYTSNNMARITELADSIKETWFSIRGKGVNFKELTDLNKAERAILSAKTPSDLELVRMAPKMSEFGQWLTENDMAIIGARGIDRPAPVDEVRLGRLAGLHASSGTRVVLENMFRAETTSAFKKFADKALDPLLLMWKTGVTVGRGPAYVITNMIGGIYMSFLGGVEARNLLEGSRILVAAKGAYNTAARELPAASDPQRLARAAEILEKKLAGQNIGKRDAFEVLREFLEFGGYGGTQTADALALQRKYGSAAPERAMRLGQTVQRRGEEAVTPLGKGYQRFVDAMLTNGYQRRMNNMAQSSELVLRFGTYIDSIKKLDDPIYALDRVNLLHFDYADLSEAEESIRRLVPFYTWTRHNVPLQLRAMVLEPGKMKKWMYAQQELRAAMEDDEDSWYEQMLPEYLQEVGGFVSRLQTPVGPIAFGSRMPYDDVNRLFKVGGLNPLNFREVAKMVGPTFTLPGSIVAGVNYDTGAAFGPEGTEATGYQALLAGTPGLSRLFGGRRGAEGELRIGDAQAYAISELFPQLSMIDRLLSIDPATRPLASKPQQERALSNFLNLTGLAALTGQSATTLTPQAITGEARRRIEKQNAIIDDTAGRMGISADWLREQIRAGYSNEEIAAAIQAGQGRREDYEREKESRRKPMDRRYADMLEAMGRGEIDLGY
jgi:hypothetical protein